MTEVRLPASSAASGSMPMAVAALFTPAPAAPYIVAPGITPGIKAAPGPADLKAPPKNSFPVLTKALGEAWGWVLSLTAA